MGTQTARIPFLHSVKVLQRNRITRKKRDRQTDRSMGGGKDEICTRPAGTNSDRILCWT